MRMDRLIVLGARGFLIFIPAGTDISMRPEENGKDLRIFRKSKGVGLFPHGVAKQEQFTFSFFDQDRYMSSHRFPVLIRPAKDNERMGMHEGHHFTFISCFEIGYI